MGVGIVIIIIGGGLSMLRIVLFKKKRKTISVGMLQNYISSKELYPDVSSRYYNTRSYFD